jgi:hypothetical protein
MEVIAMATIENAYKSSVAVKLNAGLSAVTGNMVVKTLSLGKIVQGADKDKIMPVVGALMQVLEYPAFRVDRTEVTVIENA